MIKNNANRQAMAMAVAEQAKELGFAITPEGASNDDITQRVYCLILESSPACRLTPSIAVCVSMKRNTALPSLFLPDTAYCTGDFYNIAAPCTIIITITPQGWTPAFSWDIMYLQ